MQNALDYISIKGFRSIREIDKLELRPINILVGANGSGKSNLVGAFAFLNAVRRGRLSSYLGQRGGANRILHFGSKVTPELDMEVSFRNGVNGYRIILESTDADSLSIKSEMCWFWDNARYDSPYKEIIRYLSTDSSVYISTMVDYYALP